MDTTLVENFPAGRLGAARDALAALTKRLTKAATKSGASLPEMPVLNVKAERTIARCTSCGRHGEISELGGAGVAACKADTGVTAMCPGYLLPTKVVDLEISIGRPALAGWEFLAVVEPLTAGNLVKRVPGSDTAFDLSAYRTGNALSCDHCNTIRKRTETFVVKADGSDPAVAAGTVKKVGRNCLENFLGGLSPAAILARLTFVDVVRSVGEEGGGGGGWVSPTYTPAEVLTWSASSVRLRGWVPKAAEDFDNLSTASHVRYLLDGPTFGEGARKWFLAREEFAPTEGDKAKGLAALEWAKGLEGKSDYEWSLSLIAKEETVPFNKFGFLCSAINGYERYLGKEAARKKVAVTSKYVGTVGEKLVATVTVEKVFDVDTMYGTLHVNKMVDGDGNVLVWKTTSTRFEPGSTLTLKGTVKNHAEWNGVSETELTRCKEVDAGTVLAAPKPKKSSVDLVAGEVEF